MRVGRQERFGAAVQVGEVAPPAARIRIFLPTLSAWSSSTTRRPALAGARAHISTGRATDDDDIEGAPGSRQRRPHQPEAEHQRQSATEPPT